MYIDFRYEIIFFHVIFNLLHIFLDPLYFFKRSAIPTIISSTPHNTYNFHVISFRMFYNKGWKEKNAPSTCTSLFEYYRSMLINHAKSDRLFALSVLTLYPFNLENCRPCCNTISYAPWRIDDASNVYSLIRNFNTAEGPNAI